MPNFNQLTYFDYVILFIFLTFFLRGIWIGCMRQFATVFTILGGYYLAGRYSSILLPYTQQFIDNPKHTFLLGYGLILAIAAITFTLMGHLLRRFTKKPRLGWLNRMGGLAVGGLTALVIASLVYMFLASTLSTTNDLLRKSYTSPYLQQGANVLRLWIRDSNLQKNFVQKEPAIRR